MNREIIETMKVNTRGWMFLSPAEQECLREVSKDGGVDNLEYDGEWKSEELCSMVTPSSIWRIRSDYEPEPEYIDIEVVRVKGENRLKEGCPNSQYTYLWWVQCDKDFVGFLTDEGWIALDRVATTLYSGDFVVARFRKE